MTSPVSPSQGDWVTQLLDRLDEFIALVRDRTTRPLAKVGRALVYGILIVVMALVALTLFLIAAVRFLDYVIPGHVWNVYLLLGLIATAGGMFYLRKALRATK